MKRLSWLRSIMTVGISINALVAGVPMWNETELTLRPAAAARTVTAEFRFQNTTSSAIRVVSIKSSCDCLSTEADKANYAPGESGVIRAEFSLAGREGRQEKTIEVTTDAAPDKPALLTLVIEIPEPVVVRPRSVFWSVGESPSAKEIEVIVSEPRHASLGEVQCIEPTFSARLVPGEEIGRHRVKITPSSTARIAQAAIRLNATVDGQPRVFVLYAAVK